MDTAVETDLNEEIFHEKQSRLRCALHATNNLLQKSVFSAKDFDKIATKLVDKALELTQSTKYIWTPLFNPFFTPYLGYYDIQVIQMALLSLKTPICSEFVPIQEMKKKTFQFPPDKIPVGFILHTSSSRFLSSIFGESQHWLSIPLIGDHFVVIDSTSDELIELQPLDETLDIPRPLIPFSYFQKLDGESTRILFCFTKKTKGT